MFPRLSVALAAALALTTSNVIALAAESSAERGLAAYQLTCAGCHQLNGEGIRGIFPPLARSDFLMADKARSIRIALQGISGPVTVNGVEYQGVMPQLPDITDEKAADILTYIRSAWGNTGEPVTAAEVAAIRTALAAAEPRGGEPYLPLPKPPAPFKIREVVRLPVQATRMATMPGVNWILLLQKGGDLYRLEPATGNLARILSAKDYVDLSAGSIAEGALGMTIDSKKRLYVVINQRIAEQPWHINRVVIFRSAPLGETGVPEDFKPWLRTSYPWGNSYFNHGVSKIAEGPDGMMYVSSGARTDGGEVDGGIAGKAAIYWKGGETDYTSAIWQINPNLGTPNLDVFARGIRNAFTFAWNDKGEFFTATNGPDADMPEELDFVEKGKHYGFPYQYGDLPATEKPYPHTPALPPGLTVVPAIRNFGPAAGGSPEKPLGTFDPHSSPTGLTFCGPDWPEAYRGKFLLGRFGNMLKSDIGYDLLTLDLKRNPAGIYEARVETFMAPVARPIDILQIGKKLYVMEYARAISNARRTQNPGRVLELSW